MTPFARSIHDERTLVTRRPHVKAKIVVGQRVTYTSPRFGMQEGKVLRPKRKYAEVRCDNDGMVWNVPMIKAHLSRVTTRV
jgi:hypothetical protein